MQSPQTRITIVRVAVQLPPSPSNIRILSRVASSARQIIEKIALFDAVAWSIHSCRASSSSSKQSRNNGSPNPALRDAIYSSISTLTSLIHSALFPPLDNLESPSDTESAYSQPSSSNISDSDSSWRSRSSGQRHLSDPPALQLRESAIAALTALAEEAPLSVVPHWSLFLPEHAGVTNTLPSISRRQSLANIILYSPRVALRGAAVGAATALLTGSWHFTRGNSRSVAISSPAFTTIGERASIIVTVLYSVISSAIRNEADPGVLARLMRLASELCLNAPVPAVTLSHVMCVVDALLFRLTRRPAIDRTSTFAAFSCLAMALSLNAPHFAEKREAHLMPILTLVLASLPDPQQPIAECLAVLQGLLACDVQLVVRFWSATIMPLLRSIYADSERERDVRLHAVRCVESLASQLPTEIAQASKSGLPSLRHYEFFSDEFAFVMLAMRDSFPSVRSSALRCTESFLASPNIAECEIADLVEAVCATLAQDRSISVRVFAVRTLSVAAVAPIRPSAGLLSYLCLVTCSESDSSTAVRGKSMLACANLIADPSWASPPITLIVRVMYTFHGVFARHWNSSFSAVRGCSTPELTESSERSWKDAVSLRASAAASIGNCALFCMKYCDSGGILESRLLEKVSHSVSFLNATVIESAEDSKLRCKAGEALGRLLSVSTDYRASSVSALCSVLAEESRSAECLKVKLACLNALVSWLDCVNALPSSAIADCDSLLLPIMSAALHMSVSVVEIDTRGGEGAGKLEELLKESMTYLVCACLQSLSSEATASAAVELKSVCGNLAQAVWIFTDLPDFARRFLEMPTADLEDKTAAVAAWKSISRTQRLSIDRAADIAAVCGCSDVDHTWLLAAASIAATESQRFKD